MKFNCLTELKYTAKSAGTLILNISALKNSHQTVINENLVLDPFIKIEEIVQQHDQSRLVRFEILQPGVVTIKYQALVNNGCVIKDYSKVEEVPIARMDPAVLTYLNPSRYCQSDKLYRLADNLFGKILHPFDKVKAVVDWIYNNVLYQGGSSTVQTSAYDTVTEQRGVCRDFAHLGIALCRALTIPARYFTGYAYALKPEDFHACFEAYLGGEWILFDATKLMPLNGMVKIASGRDAADAALANIFGDITFNYLTVKCSLAEEKFEPFYYSASNYLGISYF